MTFTYQNMQNYELNLDETIFQMSGVSYCSRADYDFIKTGLRLDDVNIGTGHPYEQIYSSFVNLVEDNPPLHVLKFTPTRQMWDGNHEIVIRI